VLEQLKFKNNETRLAILGQHDNKRKGYIDCLRTFVYIVGRHWQREDLQGLGRCGKMMAQVLLLAVMETVEEGTEEQQREGTRTPSSCRVKCSKRDYTMRVYSANNKQPSAGKAGHKLLLCLYLITVDK